MSSPAQPHHLPASFSPAERARLDVLRTAVAAGFYTDAGDAPAGRYPFSYPELARLAVYRAAVAAGFYNEGFER